MFAKNNDSLKLIECLNTLSFQNYTLTSRSPVHLNLVLSRSLPVRRYVANISIFHHTCACYSKTVLANMGTRCTQEGMSFFSLRILGSYLVHGGAYCRVDRRKHISGRNLCHQEVDSNSSTIH